MGGTEFWLCSTEETSLVPDSAAVAASSSILDSGDTQGIGADDTATLEQTLLALFNNMAESTGGISNSDLNSSCLTPGTATFDSPEALLSFSPLTWPDGISL